MIGMFVGLAAQQAQNAIFDRMRQQAALANLQGNFCPPMREPGYILDQSPEAKDQRQTRNDDKQEYYRRRK